jgi:uncharacterized protein involved in outer membrane biogenesis
MRLRTIFKLAAAGALMLAVALIAVAKSIDVNKYKSFLAAQVKAATGRDMTITGPLKLKIGLNPSVSVTGLEFANAAWGEKRPMLSVDRIEAQIALIPLLSREIRVRRLVLIRPSLLLEADAKGRTNWTLGPPPGKQPAALDVQHPPDGAPATRFDMVELKVEGAAITYVDAKVGISSRLVLDRVKVQPERTTNGPLSLLAAGSWNDTEFDLSGIAASPASLAAGKPLTLQLKGSIAGAVLVVDGRVTEPFARKGIDIDLHGQGDELTDVLKLAGLSSVNGRRLPPVGPFKLAARLTDSAGPLALAELDAAAGRHDSLFVAAKGSIRNIEAMSGIDMALVSESESLAALSRLTGFDLAPSPPVRLAARLTDIKNGWRLADVKASLGHSDLSGEVSLTRDDRPHLRGKFASTTLAPAEFLPPHHQTPDDGRLFSPAPLALDGLRSADMELSIAVGRLLLDALPLSDVSADLRLDHGKLTVKPLSALLAGGKVEGDGLLDASGNGAALSVRLKGADIDSGRLMREAGLPDMIFGGTGSLSVDVTGHGTSLRGLAAGLNGSVLMTMGEARLNSRTATWAGGDLLTQVIGSLDPRGGPHEATPLSCGVVHFTIKDGLATADRGIAAETASVTMVGAGTVDLRDETISIGFTPQARDGIGLSLGSGVAGLTRLRGTLANPTIGLDELGAVKTAGSVGAAVATGGLSLLAQLAFNKATADASPCRTALGKPAAKAPAKHRR